MSRICRSCSVLKGDADFYGRGRECKVCHLARKKAEYAADPETFKDRVRRYQESNPELLKSSRAKFVRSDKGKAASRQHYLKKTYGLSADDVDQMFLGQGEACAICERTDPGKTWCVDHDHVSGQVRGILCWNCNVGLGHFRDDTSALEKAIAYLAESAVRQVG